MSRAERVHKRIASKLLDLAAEADSWTDPIPTGLVLDVMDALDMVLVRMAELAPPAPPESTFADTARALWGLSRQPADDLNSSTACVRVAVRAAALAHRQRKIALKKDSPDE